jgi:hypothetical protein
MVTYTVLRGGHLQEVSIRLGRYPLGALVQDEWGFLAFTLFFALVGAYVLLRRPNDRAARTLFQSAWSMLVAVPWVFGLQVSDLFGGPSFWLYQVIVLGVYILFWISLLHFTLVFPAQHPLTVGHPELDRAVGARRIGARLPLRGARGRRDEPELPGKP